MKEYAITQKTRAYPLWMTFLRVLLGGILHWKGIVFIRDSTLLQRLIEETGVGVFTQNSSTLAFIISYLTLLCGLAIFTGLWTRVASIVQIPILIVATFFVNLHLLETNTFEFVLSLITLALLILFAFKGSGTISLDEFFRSYYKAGTEDGQTKKFFKS